MRLMRTFRYNEILRFLVGGGSAVLTDYIVYSFLMKRIDVSFAKAISYIAGAIVGFIINKLWTFESKDFKMVEIYKYCILYCCSALVNALVNQGVLDLLDISVFAFFFATGVSTIINFLGQKFFVFRK